MVNMIPSRKMYPIIAVCKKNILFLFFYFLLLIPNHGWAEDRFLEKISVRTKRDHSIIDIRLNQQLTVVSYAPLKEGDLLRLKVRITGSAFQIDETPTDFETLPWKATPDLPLYNVTVDLQGAILLYFKRTVQYEVLPGTNAFHILVKVTHPVRITKLPAQVDKKQIIKEQESAETKVKKIDLKSSKSPELAGFMNEARRAMLNKDYSRAIQLYTKVNIKAPKSIYGQQALEYLGLAREKNNQFAHAKVIYEQYLKLYPEGDDADRVSQRLSGILMSETEPRERLKEGKSKEKQNAGIQWNTFGSFSQFYNRRVSKFNDGQSRLNRSAIQNGLNITSTLESQDFILESTFVGNYNFNIETADEDEKRISTLYLDLLNKPLSVQLRAGRQSQSSGGILGRFDGLHLSIPTFDKVTLNFVAGYPVRASSDIFINNDQYFYGINADFGRFLDAWEFNAFYIEQYDHDLLDRRAIGGEISFFQENQAFFSFLDYDIYHDVVNTFLFTGQWGFADRTTINLSYDYRTSPFLTTSNALQQQTFPDVKNLDDLQDFFSIKEIKALAKDRTAITQSLAISLSRPLSDQFQINADIRVTTKSSTKTSGGVEGTDETGFDYFYSTDLTGSNLLTDGDIYVLGIRYNDLQRSNTTSATINARYPVSKELRINPRLRFDYRDNADDTKRYSYQSSVRITYRLLKGLQLEFEGGGEWEFQGKTAETLAAIPDNNDEFDRTKGYFVIVGYRYNF
jgi:hypothetical protein